MNKIIGCLQNPTTFTLRKARLASRCGMQRVSTKILEKYFGKQVGSNTKTGLRAFIGAWSDGKQHVEVINKDFARKAHGVILGKEGVKATIFENGKAINKFYTTSEQMLLDVVG